MASLAERMMMLFGGRRGAHGTYESEDAREGSAKREIKRTARTVREPVTVEMWEQHIAGSRHLGIIPINEENECWWGAVDVDVYDLDLAGLVAHLREMEVPAVVCRTKSGGAHVFLFFAAPISARLVMDRLRELSAALGHGGAEVFPKQDAVLSDRGDLGNWLNMPYSAGDQTSRYGVKDSGLGMTLRDFLAVAEGRRITQQQLQALRLVRSVPEFATGPPCLEHLVSVGIGEGSRNNGLFALGVLAKKMHADSWEPKLEEWNRRFLSPPLVAGEVQLVLRSLRKRDYTYKCHDAPCVSFCNMALCRTREHGIGAGAGARLIESVSVLKTEPPLFFVNLKTGGTVECDSAGLLSSRDFQKLVLEQLHVVVPLYKTDVWLQQVQECVESAVMIDAPREVGTTGQFAELLERFCTDRHASTQKEDILLSKPWIDEEGGRVWFRLQDLQDHLDRHRFRGLTRQQVITRIRAMGGDSSFFNIRGRGTNVWWVPSESMEWQTEQHSIPPQDEVPL